MSVRGRVASCHVLGRSDVCGKGVRFPSLDTTGIFVLSQDDVVALRDVRTLEQGLQRLSLVPAGGLASSLVVAMVALPVAAGAVEVCQGRAATLVGSPDESLVGTDGDDVIVTTGAG